MPEHDPRWHAADWQMGVQRKLLSWYRRQKRDLPWRRHGDPYAIWISEVMLQQTQVATVIPYFERFMTRFPTPKDLAEAEIDEVLRYWEGLGYYRRARQLHAAAEKIVAEHSGCFPTDFTAVLALPGVGRYTAGAILSISKDQRLPIVEANTQRLYSRLVALREPPAQTQANRLLWGVAESILPKRGCGQFNQAAMELGSLVCTPRTPNCEACPLVAHCAAYEAGLVDVIPGPVKKMQYENRTHWGLVVRSADGRILLRQCAKGEHWEGLWDLPRYDVTDVVDREGFVSEQMRNDYEMSAAVGDEVFRLKHGVTRFRIDLRVLQCHSDSFEVVKASRGGGRDLVANDAVRESKEGGRVFGWFGVDEMVGLPMNTTGRKISERLVALESGKR